MSDIILVMPPCWDVNMPPLGIAYLSRYLRSHGYNTCVYDLNIDIFNSATSEVKELWHPSKLWCWMDEAYFKNSILPVLRSKIDSWAKQIASQPSPMVGFSTSRSSLRFVIEMAKSIKVLSPHKAIIIGGPACAIEGERKLIPLDLVDIFVVGEGEETLVEILSLHKRGKKIEELNGCIIVNKSSPAKFLPRQPVKEIDDIPFPDFIEFELRSYQKKMLPLLVSRGCIGKCSFCNDWVVWPKFRFRRAQNVFNELTHHVNVHGITDFEFVDLAINGNERELEKLCDLIAENQMKLHWVANYIIRPKGNPALFKKMKAAGCVALRFGVESGSDKILKKMGKPFTARDVEGVLRQACEAKIETCVNIIVGFPGEDESDFNTTLSFIERNKKFINRVANIHPCYLTPYSDIEKNYKAYHIVLPEKDFSVAWYDDKGNTYEGRKEKALRMETFVKELGLLFDEKSTLILLDEELKGSKDRLE